MNNWFAIRKLWVRDDRDVNCKARHAINESDITESQIKNIKNCIAILFFKSWPTLDCQEFVVNALKSANMQRKCQSIGWVHQMIVNTLLTNSDTISLTNSKQKLISLTLNLNIIKSSANSLKNLEKKGNDLQLKTNKSKISLFH